ncbi:MAG: hypothetical protein K2W79_12400 [Hydrotalea flava]|nr:hypothetical protein [Hydrotalea flava]
MIRNILRLVFFIFLLTVTHNVESQCRLSDLPQGDTIALNNLWGKLRRAVNSKKKSELSKFFNFPFYCAPINADNKDSATVLVTKKMFLNKYYEILLLENFTDLVTHNRISEVLVGDLQDDASCAYSVSFPLAKSSKKSEGLQVFMTFKKIKSQYKIISIWTVP